jgi:hypothetical protein|nr:MAG TPA: hypothetical protein [Caudoviricetes sp.]
MIKIENTEIVGWEAAIRGMRNPLNSWEKSDSKWYSIGIPTSNPAAINDKYLSQKYCIGDNDLDLMKRLRNAGTDHRKFMRMITVYVDITAPLYWWKEFDTYKVGTVANSCSTMHKIHAKEFTLDDFSCEHLFDTPESEFNDSMDVLKEVIDILNLYRDHFVKNPHRKDYWWQLIQLLPSSYNQRRTVMLNYEVLANIYKSRRNHKLDEWHVFCEWIENLPYSELITDGGAESEPTSKKN